MSFPGQSLQRAWHLVDASNQTVGRLAGQISQILKGKHKPTFRPNKDMGDHVVVINAEKVGLIVRKTTIWFIGSLTKVLAVLFYYVFCNLLRDLLLPLVYQSPITNPSLLSPLAIHPIGPILGKEMERQTLSMAHRVSRWTQGALGQGHAGPQTRRSFEKGSVGHVKTQQPTTPIYRAKAENLRRIRSPPHCTTATRNNNPLAGTSPSEERRFSFRVTGVQFAKDHRKGSQ